jgi:hypothetical protein
MRSVEDATASSKVSVTEMDACAKNVFYSSLSATSSILEELSNFAFLWKCYSTAFYFL